jgi:hypothetical protein
MRKKQLMFTLIIGMGTSRQRSINPVFSSVVMKKRRTASHQQTPIRIALERFRQKVLTTVTLIR